MIQTLNRHRYKQWRAIIECNVFPFFVFTHFYFLCFFKIAYFIYIFFLQQWCLNQNYVGYDLPLHLILVVPLVLTLQGCHCKQWRADDKKCQRWQKCFLWIRTKMVMCICLLDDNVTSVSFRNSAYINIDDSVYISMLTWHCLREQW